MFFIVWGWRRRITQLGVAGPYTCPTCGWVGTFFARQVQRQLRIYWIPVMKWSNGPIVLSCRNCNATIQVPKEQRDQTLASVQPIGAPDPFGPAQAAPPQPQQQPLPQQAGGWPQSQPSAPASEEWNKPQN